MQLINMRSGTKAFTAGQGIKQRSDFPRGLSNMPVCFQLTCPSSFTAAPAASSYSPPPAVSEPPTPLLLQQTFPASQERSSSASNPLGPGLYFPPKTHLPEQGNSRSSLSHPHPCPREGNGEKQLLSCIYSLFILFNPHNNT